MAAAGCLNAAWFGEQLLRTTDLAAHQYAVGLLAPRHDALDHLQCTTANSAMMCDPCQCAQCLSLTHGASKAASPANVQRRIVTRRQPHAHAFSDVDIQGTGGIVVQKKHRLGAAGHDVIHAHRHQINADGVVSAQLKRQLELGADAICARYQIRVACRI